MLKKKWPFGHKKYMRKDCIFRAKKAKNSPKSTIFSPFLPNFTNFLKNFVATFVFKSGQKVAKWPLFSQFLHFSFSEICDLATFFGQWPLLKMTKVGRKNAFPQKNPNKKATTEALVTGATPRKAHTFSNIIVHPMNSKLPNNSSNAMVISTQMLAATILTHKGSFFSFIFSIFFFFLLMISIIVKNIIRDHHYKNSKSGTR